MSCVILLKSSNFIFESDQASIINDSQPASIDYEIDQSKLTIKNHDNFLTCKKFFTVFKYEFIFCWKLKLKKLFEF